MAVTDKISRRTGLRITDIEIRIEALKAASKIYESKPSKDIDKFVLDAARKFEEYIKGNRK